jgi:glycopeptide antibiotics resistance protein
MAKPKTNRATWLGSTSKARCPFGVVVQRLQKIVSFIAIVCATMLMWSDMAIKWWTNIVNFFLRVNHDATTSVMNNRPTGDADLHAVIWGACAVLVAIAWTTNRKRFVALALLAAWTIFVEITQPWFTDLRARQSSDLIGNVVGIGIVVAVIQLAHMRKSAAK